MAASAESAASSDVVTNAARVEAQTRRSRPQTRTLRQSVKVYFQHRTPQILAGLTVTGLTVRAFLGDFQAAELLAPVVAAGTWPFIEWGLHKYILHIKPFEVFGREFDPYFAARHRRHHLNPSYYPDVFLPKRVVLGAYAVLGAATWLVSNDPRWVATVLASSAVVTMIYEWTHYITHSDYPPKSKFARRIWRNHRMHHYRNEYHWYSFTVPPLDEWFGTGGEPNDVEPSETVRTLGVPPQKEYEPGV